MKKTNAFTMAEILISLTIIGVIAALTLPALMANLNEKVWNTQRKALHSRMSQALAAMPRLDGYRDTNEGSSAYNFVLNGLTTALNITKVCEYDKMDKCDFDWPQAILSDDDEYEKLDDEIVSFNTVNGESLGVNYNPDCTGSSNADFMSGSRPRDMMCASFLYDLNGASKGPNKIGKDMGLITAFFPEYPVVVAPMPMAATSNETNPQEVESYLNGNPDFRLPSPAESIALSDAFLFINTHYNGDGVWVDDDILCSLNYGCGKIETSGRDSDAYVILVSKNGDAPRTFKKLDGGESYCGGAHPTDPTPKPECWVCTDGEWELTCWK